MNVTFAVVAGDTRTVQDALTSPLLEQRAPICRAVELGQQTLEAHGHRRWMCYEPVGKADLTILYVFVSYSSLYILALQSSSRVNEREGGQ
jgi:hypothetical protein